MKTQIISLLCLGLMSACATSPSTKSGVAAPAPTSQDHPYQKVSGTYYYCDPQKNIYQSVKLPSRMSVSCGTSRKTACVMDLTKREAWNTDLDLKVNETGDEFVWHPTTQVCGIDCDLPDIKFVQRQPAGKRCTK